MYVQTIRADHP